MNLVLASVSTRRRIALPGAAEMLEEYVGRAKRYLPVRAVVFSTEDKLLEALEAATGKAAGVLIAADSQGVQVTSEELAEMLGKLQDNGTQNCMVGIGPADGWSSAALERADRRISFGRITLPHELAAVVASEQIYRALTIRAGHPYHSGH